MKRGFEGYIAATRHADSTTPPRLAVRGDHVALDLLNTSPTFSGISVDYFFRDEEVLMWLRAASLLPPDAAPPPMRRGELYAQLVRLRATLATLFEQRRAAEPLDLEPLNDFSATDANGRSSSATTRARSASSARSIERAHAISSFPIALAAADLLVNGAFDLVRRCANDDCALYIYDRTRSHRRRWCRTETCGNPRQGGSLPRSRRRLEHKGERVFSSVSVDFTPATAFES